MEKIIEIPEGYEARIEDNKVILKRKESEDERIIDGMLEFFRHYYHSDGKNQKNLDLWIAYLEKQKEQKPAEWSEEDEIRLKVIKEELERFIMFEQYGTPLSVDDIDWIESLPERFSLQPKQEWSDEDERIIRCITERIESDIQYGDELTKAYGNQEISWLKSLRPQPHWKPSEEQMAVLEYYMHTLICNKNKEILFSLYNSLKKL